MLGIIAVAFISMNSYSEGRIQDFEKGGLDRPHDGEVEVSGSLKRGYASVSCTP